MIDPRPSPESIKSIVVKYTRISPAFCDEIIGLLRRGESVVLLGPRHIGKRQVIYAVDEQLRASSQARERVGSIRLLERQWTNRQELDDGMVRLLETTLTGLDWRPPEAGEDLHERLASYLKDAPCHLIVSISDVDALPEDMARRLLKGVQRLAFLDPNEHRGHFTALLTGSVGLVPLVHGEGSDFRCVHQYVIQGHDEDAFRTYVTTLVSATGLRLADAAACCRFLYGQTGGSIYLARVFLDAIIEGRRLTGTWAESPLTVEEMRNAERYLDSPASTPMDSVVHAFARVENSPTACEMVAGLLAKGEIGIPASPADSPEQNPPTDVELCGLAVRQDGRLRFASPVMQRVAKAYFTDWRLGDLFACNQDWDKAFEYHERALRDQDHWVYSPLNRPQVPAAVRALQEGLQARAFDGVDNLCRFFALGVRYLLGMEEVTFWSSDTE